MSANVGLRRSQRIKEKGEERKRVACQVKSNPELLKSHSCITEGSETRTVPKMSETFKMSKSVSAESRGSRSRGIQTTLKTKEKRLQASPSGTEICTRKEEIGARRTSKKTRDARH
ncbi:hypothetical protein JTB14_004720 [Gonioctena quinquepunctata]|nr:hypothetical protein JTB14_004720 [Gonioctena quinquepunctata]